MRRHEHRAAAQRVRVRLQHGRERADVGGDHMVRHEVADAIEPERRQLREHLALVGNAASRARSRTPRCDRSRRSADRRRLVDVADLAAADEVQIGEGRFEQRCAGDHRRPRERRGSLHQPVHSLRFTVSCFDGGSATEPNKRNSVLQITICKRQTANRGRRPRPRTLDFGHLPAARRMLIRARVTRSVRLGPPPRTAPAAR